MIGGPIGAAVAEFGVFGSWKLCRNKTVDEDESSSDSEGEDDLEGYDNFAPSVVVPGGDNANGEKQVSALSVLVVGLIFFALFCFAFAQRKNACMCCCHCVLPGSEVVLGPRSERKLPPYIRE